jgi:hypothetical protein
LPILRGSKKLIFKKSVAVRRPVFKCHKSVTERKRMPASEGPSLEPSGPQWANHWLPHKDLVLCPVNILNK